MSNLSELPVVFLACKVFEDLLKTHLPPGLADRVEFLEYGLHRVPAKLTQALQEILDRLEPPSLVVLGYGLCGNGLDGLQAGPHTLLVARADDCIAILLGSYRAYMDQFEAVPGTYYLTKGWLESGSDPFKEYQKAVEKYGQKDAEWILDMQYQHYERLVLVAHSAEDLEAYRPRALQVAEFCQRWGMRYEEILGSDDYVRRLIRSAEAREALEPDDFLIIPPGGVLRQAQFLRL